MPITLILIVKIAKEKTNVARTACDSLLLKVSLIAGVQLVYFGGRPKSAPAVGEFGEFDEFGEFGVYAS